MGERVFFSLYAINGGRTTILVFNINHQLTSLMFQISSPSSKLSQEINFARIIKRLQAKTILYRAQLHHQAI
jgi:hypothetical protein